MHLECLNQWRNISLNTINQTQCSVCLYKYEIKRTNIAIFLTSNNGSIIITIIIMLFLIIFIGFISKLIINNYLKYDLILLFYQLININPFWKSCNNIYNNNNNNIYNNTIIKQRNNIYNKLSKETIRNIILFYFNEVSSNINLQIILFCYPIITNIIEIFEYGILFIGLLGFIHSIYYQFINVRNNPLQNRLQYIIILISWFLSLGSNQLGRLSLIIGFAISFRELYSIISIKAKELGQMFGEMIMEPIIR